jgi:hypothetical protein
LELEFENISASVGCKSSALLKKSSALFQKCRKLPRLIKNLCTPSKISVLQGFFKKIMKSDWK